jgi:hypothetical protein
MDDHLHRILDAEASRESADSRESTALAEAEAQIAAVLRAIPTAPLPDLALGVLQRISSAPPVWEEARTRQWAPWQRALDWFWSPRPVSLSWRPAYGVAFGLLLLLAGGLATSRSSAPVHPRILVQFRLDAPQASQVALAGNFTNWQPTLQLTQTADGVWTAVVPLEQGVHKYAFVVDGSVWQTDPLAPSVADGFGGENSQIAVLSPDMVTES